MVAGRDQDPLSPTAFYAVYEGARSIGDERQRLIACHAVLSMGRLGLRLGELVHLHEGWIDWDRGEIRVPSHDPCACETCWNRARHERERGEDRTTADIVAEEQWHPVEGGARKIGFGWSDRITAALLAVYTDRDYLDVSPSEVQSLVEQAVENATGIDPEQVGTSTLRATAGRFFAQAGFDDRSIARLLGADREVGEQYARRWGNTTTQVLADLLGTAQPPQTALAEPGETFPVACNPERFDDEPFDTAGVDQKRQSRADEQRGTPRPVENPRPADPPDDVDFDPDSRVGPDYLDPESVVVRGQDGQTVTTFEQWLAAQEQGRANTRESSSGASATGGGAGRAAAGGRQPARSRSTGGERGEPADSDDAAEESAAGSLGGDEQTLQPRERVTDPLITELSARFAAADLQDGRPVSGRVLLGQAELLLVADDDEQCYIELSNVSDVALDYTPSGLEDAFDSTVGISYRRDGDRRLAVVELPGKKQLDVSTAILKTVLDGIDVVVTHPARVGGRVTDKEPRELVLTANDRKLAFRTDGTEGKVAFNIRLSDLIHVERGKQRLEHEVKKALQIRHCTSDEATVTEISTASDREFTLLERFVMRDYRRRKQKLKQIDLSPEKKEILVALYSMGSEMDISMMMDKEADEMDELLGTLQRHGLVRVSKTGTELTGMGQMAVSDKVDDVNV